MSTDYAYRLLVDMTAKGSLAPQMDKMQSQAKGLDSTMKGLGSSLSSGIGGALGGLERLGDKAVDMASSFAKLGGAGAAAGIAFGVGLNDELERTRTSLASVFKTQDLVGSMPEGLKLAGDLIKDMKADAAALPGEFKDLVGFFRLSATPAFQLGVKPQDLEKMSAQAMTSAVSNGLDMEMAQRELALLFQGHAGSQNRFGQMLGLSGDKAAQFNQLSAGKRLEELKGLLAKNDPSAFSETYDAQKSQLIDNGKSLLARTTEPVFNSLKTELSRANEWFSKHQDQVDRFADKVGLKLEYGFEVARDKIREWTPPLVTFLTNAESGIERLGAKVEPVARLFEGRALKLLEDPASLEKLADMAKMYGAIKIGRMAMPGLRSLGSIAEAAGPTLGIGGGAELAAALAPALPALALFAVATEGAVHALTDANSSWHDAAGKQLEQIEKNLQGTGKLYDSLDRLGNAAQPVADAMGTYLLFELNNFTAQLSWATKGLADWLEKEGKYWDHAKAELGFLNDTPPEKIDRSADLTATLNPVKEFMTAFAEREMTTKKVTQPTSTTTIQKVEIVVTSNQDPSRIARLTQERLMEVTRFPRSSPNVRNWRSERP